MAARKKVIVIGAGIGGISAAYRLQQQGYDVTVYDKADAVGGRMKTIEKNGFTIDVGAGILPSAYVDTKELIVAAGLSNMMEDVTGNCAFLREGKTHYIDLGKMELGMLTTSLISLKSKFSLIKPMLTVARNKHKLSFDNMGLGADLDTETVTEYCRRELPQEVLDYIFGPFVRTMYLQPPEEASIAELFWCMKNLMGSSFSLKGGMVSLCERLAEGLTIQLNTQIQSVTHNENGAVVSLTDPNGEQRTEVADFCIIAADAKHLDALYGEHLSNRQREYLQSLQYSKDLVTTFCLKSEPAIDATLVQVPEKIDADLAALVIDHRKGSGRVPPGKGMVTAHFLNRWGERFYDKTDEQVITAAKQSVAKIIPEVETQLEGYHIERWERAATLSEPGTFKKLAGFMDDIKPDSPVQLVGDYMALSSVNVSVATAKVAVNNIILKARS